MQHETQKNESVINRYGYPVLHWWHNNDDDDGDDDDDDVIYN